MCTKPKVSFDPEEVQLSGWLPKESQIDLMYPIMARACVCKTRATRKGGVDKIRSFIISKMFKNDLEMPGTVYEGSSPDELWHDTKEPGAGFLIVPQSPKPSPM